MDLFLHGKKIQNVFQLLGDNENDISYSVSWGLAQCPAFLELFLKNIIGWQGSIEEVKIDLQKHETDKGYTDVELTLENQFHLIIEAKKGWNLPGIDQLEMYADRLLQSSFPTKRLVVLSECRSDYVFSKLPKSIKRVSLEVVSWKDVYDYAKASHPSSTNAEKRILVDLTSYLRGLMTMKNKDSNWVYVVSLGNDVPKGWNLSWRDIVNKRGMYFHPYGGSGGWPKTPPNYIAFRYDGKLQTIHHIDGYDTFTNPKDVFPEAPSEQWELHFIYSLGPAIKPPYEVKAGNVIRAQRVWCMLDTLLTCQTISDARDLSHSRK